MAKIFKFPDKKRELGQAAAQQQWLKDNEIAQQVAWDWPKGTWFRKRLVVVLTATELTTLAQNVGDLFPPIRPKGRD